MKVTLTLEIGVLIGENDETPTTDEILSALQVGFDYPSIIEQPGVEDGWQIEIKSIEYAAAGGQA